MSTVDLSSINRAAMSAKEGYWWINGIGLALSLLIAKMSFTAYAVEPDKAWICVTCQASAIALAILARRSMTGQMPLIALLAAVAAGGCAWWASHGLSLAWSKGGDPANAWMVFFLTALEPGIFLMAEHIKEGREVLRNAQEKADREMAEALAAARAKDEIYRAKSPTARQIDRQAGEGATIHRLKVVENDCQPDDLPGDPVEAVESPAIDRSVVDSPGGQPVEALPALAQPEHSAHTFADAEAHARHLIEAEGVHRRNELVRLVRGLSTYRAALLLDELAPGWRAKKAAAA